MRDTLEWLLPKLNPLREKDCTLDDAKRAWRWVFNHAFWQTPSTRGAALTESGITVPAFAIRADIALKRNDKIQHEHRDDSIPIPKGCAIRFTAPDLKLFSSDTVHWIVENTGDEATAADDLGHETKGTATTRWEDTAYKGTHRMICEVRRGPRVVARAVRKVVVG